MADKQNGDDSIEGSLPLLRNPVVRTTRSPGGTFDVTQANAQPNLDGFGYRDEVYLPGEEIPEFERHDEATNIEVFYDLFFAANLCVFGEVQDITNGVQLATFICYFCLLWFTWLALGLFDVRFVTDSIFERCVRAVHFGAMVGFAVVAPTFKLQEQDPRTFRTMSLILTTSRVALACQYGSILWHVRKFKSSRIALSFMTALNLVAAVIYLGVAFGFKETGTSALWVVWFVLTIIEIAITVWGSLRWEVLSFYGTHLTNRVSLLTFILMGEGIVTVCSAVTKIVVNANQWTSPTIGNVTAGVANIYVIYMIYVDWRRAKRFNRAMQLVWSFLHLPFHLALKLFILGSSQFVIWWKVFETVDWVESEFEAAGNGFEAVVVEPEDAINMLVTIFKGVTEKVFGVFQPKWSNTEISVNASLTVLQESPLEAWAYVLEEPANVPAEFAGPVSLITESLNLLTNTIENSLLATFNIVGFNESARWETYEELVKLEQDAADQNHRKFRTIVIAAYSAAGFTLILLNVLYIVSRSKRWTPFNYVRKALNFLVGIGLCLVPLITRDDEKAQDFTTTPWPLPTIVLTLFVVLVINHLPHPPPIFFNGKAQPQEDGKTGSGTASLVGGQEQKSGYQNVSIHDQDTETAYQGAGAGQQRYA